MKNTLRPLSNLFGAVALSTALFAQTPTPAPTPQGGTQNPPAPSGPPAKLDVDKSDHDFGTVIEGEVVKHTFHMKSSGEGNLIVTQAKPTCGCTIGRLSVKKADGSFELYKFGDPVPPGTDMEMEAELNTKNKHNAASSKINVFCNDPRGTVTLGLSAMVDTYFHLTPATIDFGEISIADVVEKSCEVTGKKPGPFALSLEPRPLPKGVKVDLLPTNPTADNKAEKWTIKVTAGPDLNEGNLGYPLALLSDQLIDGAQPGPDGKPPHYSATLMLTARVRGLISYEPAYISFGLVKPGQVMSRTVKIQSFDPKFTLGIPELKIAGPNPQTPDFKYAGNFSTAARPTADGKAVEVELTLNGLPETADGAFQGKIVIKTGHPAKPEVEVMFSGVCRPGAKPATPPATPPAGGK